MTWVARRKAEPKETVAQVSCFEDFTRNLFVYKILRGLNQISTPQLSIYQDFTNLTPQKNIALHGLESSVSSALVAIPRCVE